MAKIPFSPDELNVIGEHINVTSFGGAFSRRPPMYNTPITPKENMKHMLARDGEQMWMVTSSDTLSIESRVNKDHIARAEVMDMGPPYAVEEKGGPDMFGIEWVFVPTVGGSMVKPGAPTLTDANDWPEIIKFPDVEAMDWAACKETNAELTTTTRYFKATFQNGLFERLISFMDFEGAAMAMIDDEQKDAVHALFAKLCDMYEAMITKYMECVKIDGIMFHDDWGAQRAPFFSEETCREMLLPYIKRLADFCHSKGLYFEQHSCGKNELLCGVMHDAGVDVWSPQPMNDVDMLIEKYGDTMTFGVSCSVPMDASDDEIKAAAQAFVDKYAHKNVIASTFMAPPALAKYIYEFSRKALAE